jgi:DNA primase large subunit
VCLCAGKEGKRTDYSPWSCMKIINAQPGAGDHNGCPFKHFDEQHLRNRLRDRKVKNESIDEILQLVRDKHYQVACKKYFTVTHNNYDNDNVGNHPNAYFDASMKYHTAKDAMSTEVKKENTTAAVKVEATAAAASNTATSASASADTQPIKVQEESKSNNEQMSA